VALSINQRQSTIAILGLQLSASALVLGLALLLQLDIVTIAGAIVGVLAYAGLLVAYWRGQEWAQLAAVLLTTVLTAYVMIIDSRLTSVFSPAFFVPPVLALIMTGPLTVLGVGLSMQIALLVGLGFTAANPYADPVRIVMVLLAVMGMALARIVLNTFREQARQEAVGARQAQHEAEQQADLARQHAEQIAQQFAEQSRLIELVQVLETPSITVSDGVLLAPIVGNLDSTRAARLIERLLHDISVRRTRLLIIDISGVPEVDTQVAQALFRLVSAVRLLGTQVVLTGISAIVAQSITTLGLSFEQVATARSPQEALLEYGLSANLAQNHKQ
jgi:rsbT co-antagonist protein RsbR